MSREFLQLTLACRDYWPFASAGDATQQRQPEPACAPNRTTSPLSTNESPSERSRRKWSLPCE
jgi:hypothetical protein